MCSIWSASRERKSGVDREQTGNEKGDGITMNCFVRAAKYLCRKKRKTILLLLLFLAVNGMVMGTWAIRSSSRKLEEELRRNAEGKVLLESVQTGNAQEREPTSRIGFDESDLQKIAAMENVSRVARISEIVCASAQIIPVAGNAESEALFHVCGYDEPEKDGPFADRVFRVIEGRFPEHEDEIVINRYLAEANGLRPGDRVTLSVPGQGNAETAVCGIFLSGSEDDQTEYVATVNRTENQIYASPELVNTLSGESSCIQAIVYADDPARLAETKEALETSFGDRAVISVMDSTYQKLRQIIGQTNRVMLLILVLTVLMGGTAAGLLLAMWTRGRKREIAVLFSLGVPKGDILLQMFTEELILYGIGFAGARAVTGAVLPVIGGKLEYLRDNAAALSVSGGALLLILAVGLGVVAVLTGVSVWPYMRKQVREVLTEMEE